MKKTILVVSNGRGEDSIAITILDQFKRIKAEDNTDYDSSWIVALPLVDDGSAYKTKGYITAATWNTLPSKGFGATSPGQLLRDIKSGWFDILKTQIRVFKKEALAADLIVTVGDISPLLMACLFGSKKKIVHIATAISVYVRSYSLAEIWLFKKYVACVICRDLVTAEHLRKYGVNAAYFGNPMMDDPLLKNTTINLGIEHKKKHIVLVPSSREDAYDNLVRMLQLVKEFGKRPSMSFVVSLAPNLSLNILQKTCSESGWTFKQKQEKGFIGILETTEANSVAVVRGYFRECLEAATAIIGMTGTGNEQIAGLGIPVILLQGKSEAASWKRMLHYKKLLGDAVYITKGSNEKIVEGLVSLLDNNSRLNTMSVTGRERMGIQGGAYYIARKLFYYLLTK